ncbi:hypothetical protein ZWY2020_014103 [Hordeum vulgare]|uniref:Predicted protein n=1 Tax=Hordeum vulgare subsp. vulgare TaxID=112509 RepID=F2D803_HORVV|nr:hypothetical protein ZWY2020_014103 [Hordeum vulgare]BAJ91224.1 predicted protein [Hordeum vulgare subsp. vulgare]
MEAATVPGRRRRGARGTVVEAVPEVEEEGQWQAFGGVCRVLAGIPNQWKRLKNHTMHVTVSTPPTPTMTALSDVLRRFPMPNRNEARTSWRWLQGTRG